MPPFPLTKAFYPCCWQLASQFQLFEKLARNLGESLRNPPKPFLAAHFLHSKSNPYISLYVGTSIFGSTCSPPSMAVTPDPLILHFLYSLCCESCLCLCIHRSFLVLTDLWFCRRSHSYQGPFFAWVTILLWSILYRGAILTESTSLQGMTFYKVHNWSKTTKCQTLYTYKV